jgi:uncharacterized damage-inducible protein DinB
MNRANLAVLLLSATLAAAPLSQHERDFAMSQLHATRKMFLDSIAGLSRAQWNFKPSPDRWSIAQCAEHIALTEDSLFRLVTQKILKSPATPEKKAEVRDKDELVMQTVANRDHKLQAPESLRPTGRWPTEESLVRHFKESRDRTIAYVETTNEDLRSHFMEHPAYKLLDAYQWILLIAAHTERHTKQILEVKADPRFPKK